jgi:ATP-binding protein involved in chromosome partitioning
MSTVELINTALATVIDPELHKPLPELGMVESVEFSNGLAKIGILLTIVG